MEEVHEDGSAAAADEVPATEATEAGGDDGVRGAAEDGEGQPEGQQEEEGAEAEEAEGGGGGEKGSKVGNENKPNPWKKRKMAMFLSYLGEGYQGMQSNPGAKTIEQDLQDAIFRAGGISEENHKDARKVSWSRAARTDKGVSALGQVVSLKMVVPEGIVSRINEHLPAQIRVLGYRRTTGGFEARKLCDRRRYEYILPAWAFQPNTCRGTAPSTLRDMDKMLRMQSGSGQVTDHANDPLPWLVAASRAAARGTPTATAAEPSPAADAGASSQAPARSDAAPGAEVPDPVPVPETVVGSEAKMAMEAQEFLGHLRGLIGGEAGSEPLTSERWSLLLHLLRLYEGTHNFHNFTVGQDATAASAKRHILSFTAQPLTLVGEAWIRLLVTGQSFMLHQIRKMVGMVLAVMRGDATQRELELALDPDRDFNVPMAPALGLFLAECIFKSYNDCWASPSKPFVHDRLALDAFQDQVDEFKAKVLYPNIVARDRKFLINAFWLYSLSDKTYNFSLWHTTPKVRDTGGRKRRGAGRGGRPPKRQRQEKKQQQHQTSSAVTDGQGVAEAASKATAGESQPDEHATGLSGS